MSVVKFAPRSFEQSFNNMFDDFFFGAPSTLRNDAWATKSFRAPVNITKKESGYELQVVAPGFDKDAFKISVEKGLLTIAAEHKSEEDAKTEKAVRHEYRFQSFRRSFNLDETIDADAIEARYNNGVLVVSLPKKAEVAEPVKQISIQ